MIPDHAAVKLNMLSRNADVTPSNSPFPDKRRRDELCSVRRYSKTYALSKKNYRSIHSYDISRTVDERTAGVPGTQCGIGLNYCLIKVRLFRLLDQ